MIVYCDCRDCTNWREGRCENKWPIGTEAIKVDEDARCSDYVPSPAEGGDTGCG